MAERTYKLPGDRSYGPGGVFDDGYPCDAQAAEAAGYRRTPFPSESAPMRRPTPSPADLVQYPRHRLGADQQRRELVGDVARSVGYALHSKLGRPRPSSATISPSR
jgi:hypothetical protein